jgi:hypothetical protein
MTGIYHVDLAAEGRRILPEKLQLFVLNLPHSACSLRLPQNSPTRIEDISGLSTSNSPERRFGGELAEQPCY